MHVFAGQRATLFEVAAGALGADYDGHLSHDDWSAYGRFTDATHLQCVAHILRRVRELRESARGYGVVFPSQMITLFQDTLALRDKFIHGGATREELVACAALFETRLESLAKIRRCNTDPAIRLAVVNRKVWGGNRRVSLSSFSIRADVGHRNLQATRAIPAALPPPSPHRTRSASIDTHDAVINYVFCGCPVFCVDDNK